MMVIHVTVCVSIAVDVMSLCVDEI